MKTIHKFPIMIREEQFILLPEGAKILTVQLQAGEPYIWAEVDVTKHSESRHIAIFGTGHSMPFDEHTKEVYLGTFLIQADTLVFHVYEVTP